MQGQVYMNKSPSVSQIILIAILVIVAIIVIFAIIWAVMPPSEVSIYVKPQNPKGGQKQHPSNKNGQKDVENYDNIEPDNISGESVEMSIPSNNNQDLSQGELLTPDDILVEEIRENSENSHRKIKKEKEIFLKETKKAEKHALVSSDENEESKTDIYKKGFRGGRNNPKSERRRGPSYYDSESYPKSS